MKNLWNFLAIPFLALSLNAKSQDSTKYEIFGIQKDSIIMTEYYGDSSKTFKFADKDKDGYFELMGRSNSEKKKIEEKENKNYLFCIKGAQPGIYVYDKYFLIRKQKGE